MSIIGWIVIGALAGLDRQHDRRTDARQGWLMNTVVGVVGAFIGGWPRGLLTGGDFVAGFNLGTLLFIYRAVSGRDARA